MDTVFQEEQHNLARVEARIAAIVSRHEKDACKFQKDVSDSFVIDYEDLGRKQDAMRLRDYSLDRARQYRSYQASPYFGRLDLVAEDLDEAETYYIGQEGIWDKADGIVTD